MKSHIKRILQLLGISVCVFSMCCGCYKYYTYDVSHYFLEYKILRQLRPRYVIEDSLIRLTGEFEVVNFRSKDKSKLAIYDSLCVAHNDMTYPERTELMENRIDDAFRMCYLPNMSAIKVVSDKDFDEGHPAGTPLNEYITIIYTSALKYIDAGYPKYGDNPVEVSKPLSSIQESDLMLLTGFTNLGELYFTKKPTKLGLHTLTITLTSKDGKEYPASVKLDFSNQHTYYKK